MAVIEFVTYEGGGVKKAPSSSTVFAFLQGFPRRRELLLIIEKFFFSRKRFGFVSLLNR